LGEVSDTRVEPDMIRPSIGLEELDDILWDLGQTLESTLL
jgi:O-acetylhomoserine/O-acetylserine sulfhydrylase-like pyridoxal-dependent enzyme